MFKPVASASPDIEREDDYKPKLLNANSINIEIESNGIPGEGSSNPIASLKDPKSPPTPFGISKQASNVVAQEDVLNNEEMDNLVNPILYVRGVPSDSFYLILSGKVMICSGNEGFLVEQGAFNYMGVDCLTNDNYVPDFSAKVIGKAKLLKITRQEYRK